MFNIFTLPCNPACPANLIFSQLGICGANILLRLVHRLDEHNKTTAQLDILPPTG